MSSRHFDNHDNDDDDDDDVNDEVVSRKLDQPLSASRDRPTPASFAFARLPRGEGSFLIHSLIR